MGKINTKMYFKDVDDTRVTDLTERLQEAREEGISKVTLIEAINAGKNDENIWCMYNGEAVDHSECKKSQCHQYSSKSGRGVCKHRGDIYYHGEEVEFDVPQ